MSSKHLHLEQNLNVTCSWTRRDSSNARPESQHAVKRKYPRSPSPPRSRSRSPAESYLSRRSSRGRSKSRSVSPINKRRRRDLSPVNLRSRTPSERSVQRPQKRPERDSRSPSPNGSPMGLSERRRSPSVLSSASSQRSPSTSSVGQSRSMHRLPQMNHGSMAVQNAYARGPSNGMHRRKHEELRNGKPRPLNSHRKANDRPFISDLDDDHPSRQRPLSPLPLMSSGQAARTISISMPPPASVPVPQSRTRHTASEFIPVPLLSTGHSLLPEPRTDIPTAKSNLIASTRNIGFKPIGKASSLKKFFPGDEEEMDITDVPSTMNRMTRSDAETLPSQDPRHVGWAEFHEPTINLRGYPPNDSLYRASSYNQPTLRSAEVADIPARHLDPDKILLPPLLPSESLHSLDEHEQLSPHQEEVRNIPSRSRTSPRNDYEAFGGETCTPSNKDLYKIISQVGEGTFGQVYKARNTITGTHAALKRIRMESERDGFPVTAMREIKLLQSLRHENVVRLYEMMVSKGENLSFCSRT